MHNSTDELLYASSHVVKGAVRHIFTDRIFGGDTEIFFYDVYVYEIEIIDIYQGHLDVEFIEWIQVKHPVNHFQQINPDRERRLSTFRLLLNRFAPSSNTFSSSYTRLDYIVTSMDVGDEVLLFLNKFSSANYLRIFYDTDFVSSSRSRFSEELFILTNPIQSVLKFNDSNIPFSSNRYNKLVPEIAEWIMKFQ